MSEPLIAPSFQFRYAVPCRHRKPLWTADGAMLDDSYRLLDLGALDGRPSFAEVSAAWSEEGVAFGARVQGKRQLPWCRETRLADSDGLRVWLDTRDTHDIHRATRFCHQFIFLPAGGGRRLDDPVADQMLVSRARENPYPVRPGVLQVRREKRVDGYVLEAYIPADALTGYDPGQTPRLGFQYALVDRELGVQTFSCPPEFPYAEDPSLWATLDLVKP